jgi:hypothetical protein
MSRLRNGLLLLLLAVCAVSFWLGRREQTAPASADAPAAGAMAPQAPPLSIHLVVLNGTGESGLARRISRDLPSLGCVVVAIGDAPHDSFAHSLLVNRRLASGRTQRLAAALRGIPVIQEWDPRCPEDAVLVLGRDHQRLFGSGDGRP